MVNDYLAPFAGTYFSPPPAPPPIGTTPLAEDNFFWGQGNISAQHRAAFNAIHMALIPKGPHQGKILVMGAWFPVRLVPNSTLEPAGRRWYCQAWSIIDPDNPSQRFRNYLLPLEPELSLATEEMPGKALIADLFCTGHAWDQDGNLVVSGGATSVVDTHVVPPFPVPGMAGGPGGAKYLFLFDPARASQAFSTLPNLYAAQSGHWQRQSLALIVNRFYPSVTLSQLLARLLPAPREVMIVSGSSDGFDPGDLAERTYETYVCAGFNPAGNSLLPDPDPNPTGPPVLYDGPNPSSAADHLEEYTRLHLLRTNQIFKSGPLPLSAQVDQDTFSVPGSQPGVFNRPWDITVGRNVAVPSWPHQRHDGASLLLCFSGFDRVVRLGGGNAAAGVSGALSTDTSEVCDLSGGPANWVGFGGMPGGPRQFPNAVVLPDGSILVIGGADNGALAYTRITALRHPVTGWQPVANADTPTRRGYHSTAVLMPDGRVFVGGGELLSPQNQDPNWGTTESDYDMYVPHYLQGNPVRPQILRLIDSADQVMTPDPISGVVHLRKGETITIEGDAEETDYLDHAVLMAPGSITHHSDMTARYVKLSGSQLSTKRLKVLIPDDGSVPRGFYMLFVLGSSGVPSVATWVKVVLP